MNIDAKKIQNRLTELCGKSLAEATEKEIYHALLLLVQEVSSEQMQPVSGKKLYYISAEFLIGKLLSNNLINLGVYEEVKELLAQNGKSLAQIEEIEPEPSLGNGGLGRLAACFIDSIATLGLNGEGIGLNYHYGLFQQKFVDHKQREEKIRGSKRKAGLQRQNYIFLYSLRTLLWNPHYMT